MNAGYVWWNQIGNSLRLIDSVAKKLQNNQSVVLRCPDRMPWRREFENAVDYRRSAFSGDRGMVRLKWEKGENPGEMIIEELCDRRVQADYFPGQTYGAYLGSRRDIELNDYFVWITGIGDPQDLKHWVDFVEQYDCSAGQDSRRGIFVLEYTGEAMSVDNMDEIVYTIQNHDCRVFCLETASALDNAALPSYQAELALCIGGTDPEFCNALLLQGDKLLWNPMKAACKVLSEGVNSSGAPFCAMTEQQIESAAWKAGLMLVFPVLERYRLDFIVEHEAELARHLPITNSNGDKVTDAYDLEVGSLQYISNLHRNLATKEEADLLQLCRKLRNTLAHNRPAEYRDVEKIMQLVK